MRFSFAVLVTSILTVVGLGISAAWGAGSEGSTRGQTNRDAVSIEQADFCKPLKLLDSPPGDDCTWKQTSLPKQFYTPNGKDQNGGMNDAWFRLRFKRPASNEPIALYAVGFNPTGRVFVNGHFLLDIGPMGGVLPHNWNRSQYVSIPPDFIHPGLNDVEIQVRGYSDFLSYLGPVQIGNAQSLRRLWEERVFWQNEVVLFLSVASAVIGLVMLGVWLGRREDTKYLWFGISALCWVCLSIDFGIRYPLLSQAIWSKILDCSPLVRTEAMYLFALRYAGRSQPVAERVTLALCGLVTLAVCSEIMRPTLLAVAFPMALTGSLYISWLLIGQGLKHGIVEGLSLAVAAITQTVLSAVDLEAYMNDADWGDKLFYAVYSEPLFLIVIFVILMRQFIESLNAYKTLAAVMEARVEEKRLELAANYHQLVEARRNEGIAKERARIMGEMHDGIGSQLTMALSMVSRTEEATFNSTIGADVAQVLRESIEDLQLIIDSLEPVENDLLTVLGTLRYRLQSRLSKSGLAIDWKVQDLPPLPMLTPQAVLSILRIIQEAFANSIKHSGATEIQVSTGLLGVAGADETVSIVVKDNGSGFLGERVGRGLENMRRRAAALCGTLIVASGKDGTVVTLSFPTERRAT